MKEQAADIIGNLTLNTDGFIRTFSLHGVNNMLGNGFEITLKNHNVILKAGIVTHDYKEGFKAKSKLTEINEGIVFNRTSFRCVKPIFHGEI